MNLEEIKAKVASEEYGFLKTNKNLGNNIILLGLGGSHAYGMDMPGSDLDVRGCTLNKKEEILTRQNFEQFEHKQTDTVIYSFNKYVKLISDMNPNCIEILGLKPEHYLYLSDIGKELVDNADMFLSKKAAYTFGGYSRSQLHRLDNKSARSLSQSEKEAHILNSIKNAKEDFNRKYFEFSDDEIKLYIDDAVNPDIDKEIFMDINLRHYPLRDYKSMWSQMNNIVKDYAKLELSGRNRQAVEHDKLGKHMAHLVRLYFMCFDILEREKVVTYREKEHCLLMDLRNGKYLGQDKQPTPEFFEMVNELDKRMEYAKENTCLPDKPDYKRIDEFVMSVNEKVVKEEV